MTNVNLKNDKISTECEINSLKKNTIMVFLRASDNSKTWHF